MNPEGNSGGCGLDRSSPCLKFWRNVMGKSWREQLQAAIVSISTRIDPGQADFKLISTAGSGCSATVMRLKFVKCFLDVHCSDKNQRCSPKSTHLMSASISSRLCHFQGANAHAEQLCHVPVHHFDSWKISHTRATEHTRTHFILMSDFDPK